MSGNKAIITPVHKKGLLQTALIIDLSISITCVCCKLLERIFVNKLHDHLRLLTIYCTKHNMVLLKAELPLQPLGIC